MIHIAIISHGHEDMLIESQLCGLAANPAVTLWVKDNLPSVKLEAFCLQHQVRYTKEKPGMGFGENNNFLFNRIAAEFSLSAEDLFIVMNPDIQTNADMLRSLDQQMRSDSTTLATVNLYKDANFQQTDANVRFFPSLLTPFRVFKIRGLTEAIQKHSLIQNCDVDWASGAFLAFRPSHFRDLNGFDTDFFMYFEDVDICYRSYCISGRKVRYYPGLKAVHQAAHRNRSLLSPHARWFLSSFIRFVLRRSVVYPFTRGKISQSL
ncbi:hypothetical protein [Undibacterium squillarum]|uniref:hypothetical protein n=1 Tax=Undibacterium squillarum TaxID=1131567 RepID=UPI0035AFD16B